MKQRKVFIEKVKQWYAQHKDAIEIIFRVVIGIAIFTSGYLVSANLLKKPISNREFELYEQMARSVYEQREQSIYEVPKGIHLDKTATSIIISSDKVTVRGKVIANLQNGELVFTRKSETGEAIVINSLIGFLFVLVSLITWLNVPSFNEKNKKCK